MIFKKYYFSLKSYLVVKFYKLIFSKKVYFGSNLKFENNFFVSIGIGNCYLSILDNSQFRNNISIRIIDDGKLHLGKSVFFNSGCSINCMSKIIIGNNSTFGEGVKIYDHNHIYSKNILINEQGYSTGSIIVGNNCWIGSNVVILKNVTIGDNCVIGAGCVIHKSIPNNSLVVNNQNLTIKSI